MDLDRVPILPGWTIFREAFADGPPRWYARRGRLVLAASSAIDVVGQIWDHDTAWTAPPAATVVTPAEPLAAIDAAL